MCVYNNEINDTFFIKDNKIFHTIRCTITSLILFHNVRKRNQSSTYLSCLPQLGVDLPPFPEAVFLSSPAPRLHANVWMCSSVLGKVEAHRSCIAHLGSSQRTAGARRSPQRSQSPFCRHST